MEVPFADLRIINNNKISDAVRKVFETGKFINGPYCRMFSEEWAKICGTKHCVPVASGSAALISILKAIRTTVSRHAIRFAIIPDLSFAATSFSAVEAGLLPLFCRCLPNGLMDQDHCIELLDSYGHHVSVVMPVHLYGQMMEIRQEILESAIVVEDACQAHGVFTRLQGIAAAFSFYPSKNLGAAGDAGAVVCNLPGLKLSIEAYINYGDAPGEKYVHDTIGNNLRMDEIQAAVLLMKLDQKFLDVDLSIRECAAVAYRELGVPSIATNKPTSWHLYPILVEDPPEFQKKFAEVGIQTGMHYPYTLSQLHKQPLECTNSKLISEHVLTLPIGPHISLEETTYVADSLRKFSHYRDNLWRLK